jgi:O-antigen/teichoic acid export membrane protein
MNRNFLFMRSIVASLIAKAFGFFVVFACLPLAAISMKANEYATFNYSMAITSLFTIFISPVSAAFVGRLAHVSAAGDKREFRRTTEESFTIFISLGAILLPVAAGVAYLLSPGEYRGAIAVAAASVIMTNILAWTEAYRVATREDYISSAFGLGNNVTIIVTVFVLFHWRALTLESLMIAYYGSPLLWNLLSFAYLAVSRHIRIRWHIKADLWKHAAVDAAPMFALTISDYARLYLSSMVAFYLVTPQSYAVFSTLMIFVARLTNPVSLLARPLVPAYVDAVKGADEVWLVRFRQISVWVFAFAIISVAAFAVSSMFVDIPRVHLGAIQIEANEVKPYLVLSLLQFWSIAISMVLASIFLAQRRMGQFSKVSMISNGAALLVGAALAIKFDAIALFAAITVFGCIGAGYLAREFLDDGFARSVPFDMSAT